MDDLSPMISKEISDLGADARAGSAQQLYKDYTGEANQAASGLMADTSTERFNAGLGGNNDPTLSAIKNKYNKQFSHNQQRLSLGAMRDAEEDNLRKIQVANQLADQEMEMNRQKEMLKQQMKKAKRAARSATIGNILGVAGAGAGFAFGGGPAGAAVGMGSGQAIGNMAGQAGA